MGDQVKPSEPVELLEQFAPPFSVQLMNDLGLSGLHCGCGRRLRAGWLNVDMGAIHDESGNTSQPLRLARLGDDLYYLQHDVTEPLPIDDASFDWIYSEHLIEHLGLKQAVTWLKEMHRLLKPGGGLRLSTPDLRRYVEGYLDPRKEFFDAHRAHLATKPRMIERNRRRVGDDVEDADLPDRPAWMLNQIFRFWFHQWIYDFEEVRYVAEQAGFPAESVIESSFQQGRSAEVHALDNEVRSDESLYVEMFRR